jgi:hypothetical protein
VFRLSAETAGAVPSIKKRYVCFEQRPTTLPFGCKKNALQGFFEANYKDLSWNVLNDRADDFIQQ